MPPVKPGPPPELQQVIGHRGLMSRWWFNWILDFYRWVSGAVVVGPVASGGSSTDNAVVRWNGSSGTVIQNSNVTLSDAGAFAFPDGVRQTFNPDATNAGINVGAVGSEPASPANGDIFYDSATNELKAYINGSWVSLTDADIQALLDSISSTQGAILYRGAADWEGLNPGTSGQFLQTQGAGANPQWADEGGGDVTGPASSGDGNVVLFDGLTGKVIKDGGTPGSFIENTGYWSPLTDGVVSAPELVFSQGDTIAVWTPL